MNPILPPLGQSDRCKHQMHSFTQRYRHGLGALSGDRLFQQRRPEPAERGHIDGIHHDLTQAGCHHSTVMPRCTAAAMVVAEHRRAGMDGASVTDLPMLVPRFGAGRAPRRRREPVDGWKVARQDKPGA